jgi:hypothetical protein
MHMVRHTRLTNHEIGRERTHLGRAAAAMIIVALAPVFAPHGHAQAGGTPPPADAASPSIRAELRAGAWLARLRGDWIVRTPMRHTTLDLDLDLGLSDLDAAPNVELDFSIDRWFVRVGMFDFSTDGDGVAPSPFSVGDLAFTSGESVRSSLDLASVGVEAGYLFELASGTRASLEAGPAIGLRHLDLDQSIAAPDQPDSADVERNDDDVAAFAGARLRLALLDTVTLSGGAGVGATLSEGGAYFQADVGATWSPHPAVGFSFGYRIVAFTMETGEDHEFDGHIAGLFVGGSIRF